MKNFLLDTYSDLLIFNQGQASATVFSEATDGKISHDKFTRFSGLTHLIYNHPTIFQVKSFLPNLQDFVFF